MPRSAARAVAVAVAVLCHAAPARGTEARPRTPPPSAEATPAVLQHHAGQRRDGVYVDRTLTRAAAARFHLDGGFDGRVDGAVYGQPLYVPAGPGGTSVIVVATERNEIAALDARTGATVWKRRLGTPVPLSALPCGNIDPLGVTGTPIIEPDGRTVYADAMVTPDSGKTMRHLLFALSLDDGATRPGWPIDVAAAVSTGGRTFDPSVQNQRGALALVRGFLYLPYGGHFGDCGAYHGWLVAVPIHDPSRVSAWMTPARGGGIWGPSGASSDGDHVFVATGNTFGATKWAGGEALLAFTAGAALGQPAGMFAPSDWKQLDEGDTDLGGTGPMVLDVSGATPSKLLVGLGKDGKLYLVDRERLGGIGGAVGVFHVASGPIINAAAAYSTAKGSYVVFSGTGRHCPGGQSGDLTAVRIVPGSPPRAAVAWCAQQGGRGSPMVTTTDGHSDAIVWSIGAEGDGRLRGFDGDTGRVIFVSRPGDAIKGVRRFQTPIVANGRIVLAADGHVVAFTR